MAGVVGLQQLLRMQGLEWGDSGRGGGDYHLWFDGGGLNSDGPVAISTPSPTVVPLSLGAPSQVVPTSGFVYSLYTNPFITSQTDNSGNQRGMYSNPTLTGANGLSTLSGFYAFVIHSGTGLTGDLLGVVGRVSIQSTGSATNAFGLYGSMEVTAAATAVTSAGGVLAKALNDNFAATITNYQSVMAEASAVTLSAVTNNYGVRVSGQPTGATGNNIGLMVGTALSGTNTAHAAIAGTYTDPAATQSMVIINPTFALTANSAINTHGINLSATTTNTAFNYTGTLSGVTSTFAIAGTGTIGTVHGMQGLVNINTAVNNGAISVADGGSFRVSHFGVGTITTMMGVDGQALLRASGTAADGNITTAAAVRGTIQNLGTSVTPGVITNAYTFHAKAPSFSTTGTITNMYGLYVENMGNAKVTNAYGVVIEAPTSGVTLNRSFWVKGGEVRIDVAVVQGHATAAINSTNTATAAQVATGYITSTSAAPTTITLPTGSALGTALGATQGTIHYLTVDNTAGASTVTVAVAVNGILSADAVANAGSAGLLTIPNGVTGQGTFMLMFSSATAYTFSRIA